MSPTKLHLGIDVGSTTVKAVVIDPASEEIIWKDYQRHETQQAEKVLAYLKTLKETYPHIPDENYNVFMTGSGGMTLASYVGAKFVQEVTAVCAAAEKLHPEVGTIIDLGGQDSKIIIFKSDDQTGRKKKSPSMNDKCAGGTGAVIDKIKAKLNLSHQELCEGQYDGLRLHHVAGKCGVFAETDINGLQKLGVPKNELMASLYEAIVTQNLTVLTRGHTVQPHVLLLGGPNAYILGLKQAWQHNILQLWKERGVKLPEDIEPLDLIKAPDNALYFAAIGSIVFGSEDENNLSKYSGTEALEQYIKEGRLKCQVGVQPGLFGSKDEIEEFKRKYSPQQFKSATFQRSEAVAGFIGLDVGSTSTKAVLLNAEKTVLLKSYQLSKGNPIDDTKQVLGSLLREVESNGATLEVLGIVTTGYAKNVIRDVLKADAAIVETVAHTESAIHFYNDVDVICDVGGQDIKIMILKDGKVKDFKLNTQCSAGNGYFLQSTAFDFGVPVDQYAEEAFKATKCPTFGYGCAVFLQSDIVSFQRQGWKREEILTGLAKVLPKNIWLYVAQIPNFSKLGLNFILQGGTQYNLAAVKAQVDFIESRFIGKEEKPVIRVHEHCGESGAIGAALEAIRIWQQGHNTTFIGLEQTLKIQYTSTTNESTRCHFCKNKCLRTFIDVSIGQRSEFSKGIENESSHASRRFIVGNACEKGSVENVRDMEKIKSRMDEALLSTPNLIEECNEELFKPLGLKPEMARTPKSIFRSSNRQRLDVINQRSKLKIGIPRVLLMYSLAPLFRGYFESLGIQGSHIIFSDYTSEKLYKAGCKRGAIDPCYPAKVCLAHVHSLVFPSNKKKKPDIIFSPMICDLKSELSNTLGNWICPAVVASPESVKAAFTKEADIFEREGIKYVNTFLNLAEPKLFEIQMFNEYQNILGVTKEENQTAVEAGFAALMKYRRWARRRAKEVLVQLERNNKIGIVMLGRPYHGDPGINHGIFTEFQKLGYPIFTQDVLPTDEETLIRLFGEEIEAGIISDALDISDVWKNSLSTNVNMKLWSAKFVARHPNLVAVEMSSFKCGHDAPTYNVIEEIIETSGTPYFSFKDIDENKPAGSINLRIETIDYFLKRYQAERVENSYSKVKNEEPCAIF
jgi:predicted CoA-substrate-specific enzyme activase